LGLFSEIILKYMIDPEASGL